MNIPTVLHHFGPQRQRQAKGVDLFRKVVMMLRVKRFMSTSVLRASRVLTFPGQGQPVEKTLVEQLHREYDLSSYFKTLESQISPQFSSNVLSPPEDFYLSTSNTQPSIVSISLLILDLLKKHHGIDLVKNSTMSMGHSLGEYTALCANDIFHHNRDQVLWLVRQRGILMEEALQHSQDSFGMHALVFPAMNYEDMERLLADAIKEVNTVGVANINSAQQIVISGEKSELEHVVQHVKDRSNIKRRLRIVGLPVKTPFHNPLLESAKLRFKQIVETKFAIERDSPLKLPIISNLTGEIAQTHGQALDNFIDDFIKPVQFKKSVESAIHDHGVVEFVNIGPNGSINMGNVSKTDVDKKLNKNHAVGTVEEIKLFVEQYGK